MKLPFVAAGDHHRFAPDHRRNLDQNAEARPRKRTAAAAAQTRRNQRQKNVIAADEIGTGGLVLGEEAMDAYDSGGCSADKAPGAEEEGSTAPLLEKDMAEVKSEECCLENK